MSNQSKESSGAGTQICMSFEERIVHLSTGYENSQSLVRFLDTKAIAVLGVVPIVLGVLGALFKWQHEMVSLDQLCNVVGLTMTVMILIVMLLLALFLLFLSCRTVHCVFSAVNPRGQGKAKPAVLFPAQGKEFLARLKLFTELPIQNDAIEDYERQLSRMGEIVAVKFQKVGEAIRCLMHLFIWAGIAVAVMLMLVVGVSVCSLVNDNNGDSASNAVPEQSQLDDGYVESD